MKTFHLPKENFTTGSFTNFHSKLQADENSADAAQIRQVLMSLIINASEAIGEKSGMISIRTGMMRADHSYLFESYLSPGLPECECVYLEMADSGCGMSAMTKAKVFDPFFTTKFTGRGLGLAAVSGIVRGHKGALKIYSELGKGTTFKLVLPCTDLGNRFEAPQFSCEQAAWQRNNFGSR